MNKPDKPTKPKFKIEQLGFYGQVVDTETVEGDLFYIIRCSLCPDPEHFEVWMEHDLRELNVREIGWTIQ